MTVPSPKRSFEQPLENPFIRTKLRKVENKNNNENKENIHYSNADNIENYNPYSLLIAIKNAPQLYSKHAKEIFFQSILASRYPIASEILSDKSESFSTLFLCQLILENDEVSANITYFLILNFATNANSFCTLESVFRFLDSKPLELHRAYYLEVLQRYLTTESAHLIHQISIDPFALERWLTFCQNDSNANHFHQSLVAIPFKIEFLKSDLCFFRSIHVELETWQNCIHDQEILKRALFCSTFKICSLEHFFELYKRFPQKIVLLFDNVSIYGELLQAIIFEDEKEIDLFINLCTVLRVKPELTSLFREALKIAPAALKKCFLLTYAPESTWKDLLYFFKTYSRQNVYSFLDLLPTLQQRKCLKEGILTFTSWLNLGEKDLFLLLDSLKVLHEDSLAMTLNNLYTIYDEHPLLFDRILRNLRNDSQCIVLITSMCVNLSSESIDFCPIRLEHVLTHIEEPSSTKNAVISLLRSINMRDLQLAIGQMLYLNYVDDRASYDRIFTKLPSSSPLIYWHLMEFYGSHANREDYDCIVDMIPRAIKKHYSKQYELRKFLTQAEALPTKLLYQLNDLIYFNQYDFACMLLNSYSMGTRSNDVEKIANFVHHTKRYFEGKFLFSLYKKKHFNMLSICLKHIDLKDSLFIVDFISLIKLGTEHGYASKLLGCCIASFDKMGYVPYELRTIVTYVNHYKTDQFEPLYDVVLIPEGKRSLVQDFAFYALNRFNDAHLAMEILQLSDAVANEILPRRNITTVKWLLLQRKLAPSNNPAAPSPKKEVLLFQYLKEIEVKKASYGTTIENSAKYYNEQLTFLSQLVNDCVAPDASINIPLLHTYLAVSKKLAEKKLLPSNVSAQIKAFLKNPKLWCLLGDLEILDDQNHPVFAFVRAQLGKHHSAHVQKADVVKAILMTLFCYVRQGKEGNCAAVSLLTRLLNHGQEKIIKFFKRLLIDGKLHIQKKNMDSWMYYPHLEPDAYCLNYVVKIDKHHLAIEINADEDEFEPLEKLPAVNKLSDYLGIPNDKKKEWIKSALSYLRKLDHSNDLIYTTHREFLKALLDAYINTASESQNRSKIKYEGGLVYLSEFEPIGSNLLLNMFMTLANSGTFYNTFDSIIHEVSTLMDEPLKNHPIFKQLLTKGLRQELHSNITLVYHPTIESKDIQDTETMYGRVLIAHAEPFYDYNLKVVDSSAEFKKLINKLLESTIQNILNEYGDLFKNRNTLNISINELLEQSAHALYYSSPNGRTLPWQFRPGGIAEACFKQMNAITQYDKHHEIYWPVHTAEDLIDFFDAYFKSYDPAISTSRERIANMHSHGMNFHFEKKLATRIHKEGLQVIKAECRDAAIRLGNEVIISEKAYHMWSNMIRDELPEHLRKKWDQQVLPYKALLNTTIRNCYTFLIQQAYNVQSSLNVEAIVDKLSGYVYSNYWESRIEDYALEIIDSNWVSYHSKMKTNCFLSVNPLTLKWEFRTTDSFRLMNSVFGNGKYFGMFFDVD